MAHKRRAKDEKKDYIPNRGDSSNKREYQRYQKRNKQIIFFAVVAVIVAILVLTPVVLFLTPWGNNLIGVGGGGVTDSQGPDNPGGPQDPYIPPDDGGNPRATINIRDHGTIIIELYPEYAPITVENFIKYAEDGYYNGLIFHRVIKSFMIQAGGFNPDMSQEPPTYPSISNEAISSGLNNAKYTLAMARTNDPDSATSQFFINTVDNPSLNPGGNSEAGYCAFGKVISGTSVVHSIENVSTQSDGGHADVPVEDVIITSVTITR